jgi:hypothetical protein
MTLRLTRRSFLALLGVAVAGGGAAAARLLTGDSQQWSGPARTAAMLFDDPDAARRLGEAWLEHRPQENDLDVLVGLLSQAAPGLRRALNDGDAASVRRLAGRQAVHELAAGDLRHIDGWLLAPTEARLAALLAAS